MAKKKVPKSVKVSKTKKVTKSVKKVTKPVKKVASKKDIPKVQVTAVQEPITQPRKDIILHSNKENITKKDKTNSLIFIGVLVVIIALLILIAPDSEKATENIYQNPAITGPHLVPAVSSQTTSIGDVITLNVEARNFEKLTSYQMMIKYNSEVLRFKELRYDDFLGVGDKKICVNPSFATGELSKIACARIPSTPGVLEGVDGDGNLLYADFEVIGRGNANIMISDVILLNNQKAEIQAQIDPLELKSR